MRSPIDSRVAAFVRQQVADGVHNVSEMQRHGEAYVKNVLFSGKKLPSRFSRRYYPTRRDFSNLIYRARIDLMHSRIDQENLLEKMKGWESQSDDSFMFRPYVKPKTEVTSDSDAEEVKLTGDDSDGLLFVHQTTWQKKLLAKYGSLCLLDATYRTTRYALPLFFVCVKTNVDYVVVATFVTQNETSESIAEALSVIKGWNADWIPNAFMIDFCEAEINAVEKVFLGNVVHIYCYIIIVQLSLQPLTTAAVYNSLFQLFAELFAYLTVRK